MLNNLTLITDPSFASSNPSSTYAFFKGDSIKSNQQDFNLFKGTRGGRRPNSGRKRIHSRGVSHRVREKVSHRTPLHINFKYRTHIRNKVCLRLLKKAIINARTHGLKIIHFSLQSNHVHLIIESESNKILTKGMRSLTVTFAKGLKKGRVQVERYHLHVLKSIKETRNAVLYVLFNKQKHEKGTYLKIDEYSSIMLLSNAIELIRTFCQKRKMTLKISSGEKCYLDSGTSYFINRATSTAHLYSR